MLKLRRFGVLIVSLLLGLFVTMALVSSSGSQAASTDYINFQGKLTDANGYGIVSTSRSITFCIFSASSGGSCAASPSGQLWYETKSVTTDARGIFNTALGDTTTFGTLFTNNSNADLYLGINVAGDGEMTLRHPVGSVPKSFNSSRLEGNTWAVPGAIGTTTANSGAFTTLSASGVLTSTVASGTAPFTIASNTMVSNLNADLLDGSHAAAFAPSSGSTGYIQNQTASDQNASYRISGSGQLTSLGIGASPSGLLYTYDAGNTNFGATVNFTRAASAGDYLGHVSFGGTTFGQNSGGDFFGSRYTNWDLTDNRWESGYSGSVVGPSRLDWNYNGDIMFKTMAPQTLVVGDPLTFNNTLTLKGAGNVGIGTASPTGRLHSYISNAATTTSQYTGYFENLSTNTTTDAINKYGMYITSTGTFTGGAGTATNNYGLYVNTPSGADNNYAAVFAGGNVGIGTASPVYSLDVAGDVRVGSRFRFGTADADTGTNNAILALDAGTGKNLEIYNYGENGVLFKLFGSTRGANIGYWNSLGDPGANSLGVGGNALITGNVGIGTTSPGGKLDVAGGFITTSYNTGNTYPSFDDQGSNRHFGAIGWNFGAGGGAVDIWNTSTAGGNQGFVFRQQTGVSSQTPLMTINGSGNVGIGNTSPTAKLQVTESAGISSGATTMTVTGQPTTTFSTSVSTTLYAGDYIIPTTTTAQARTVANTATGTSFTVTSNFTANIAGETFTIYRPSTNITNNAGTASRLFIQGSTGNVGIGTTSPDVKLHIAGNFYNPQLKVDSSGNDAALSLKDTASGGNEWWIGSGATASGSGANLYFLNLNSGQTRMVISNSTGNVGIGATAPTYKLEVAPTSGATAGQTVYIQDATATTGATKVVVKGGAGQSSTNLQEWVSYAGNVIGAIDTNGRLFTNMDGGNNYRFTLDAANGGGPRLSLGTSSTPSSFFEVGAWNNINNFDSKTRDLKLFNGGGYLYLENDNGNVGIGVTVPTGKIHLAAGTTAASSAPLKFTSGTNMTAAEAGAVEWDGSRLYITQTTGPTRKTLAYTDDSLASSISIGSTITSSTIGSVLYVGASNQLAQSNANFFYDYTNNRLGLGTTIPANALDVYGTMSATSVGSTYTASKTTTTITATAGTFATGDVGKFFVWANGTIDTITAYISSSQVTVASSASIGSQTGYTRKANLFVNASGNVGINNSNPSAKLDIRTSSQYMGNAVIASEVSDNTSLRLYRTTGGPGTSYPWYIENNVGSLLFKTGSAALIGSETVATVMAINASGQVGIGTTSQGGILHTVATTYGNTPVFERGGQTTDGMWSALRIYATKTTSMNDGFGSQIAFNISDDTASNVIGYIGATRAGADNTGDLVFTSIAAGSESESMRIKSNGNVGIGTTNPGAKLQVAGRMTNTQPISSLFAPDMYMATTTQTSADAVQIAPTMSNQVSGNEVTDFYALRIKPLTYATTKVVNNYGLYIEAGTAGTNNYGAYIAGNVGIGNTSPVSRLTVTGSSSVGTVGSTQYLTADGTFATSSGWSTPGPVALPSAGWDITTVPGTVYHATGNTAALSGTSTATNTGVMYKIDFTTTVTTAGDGFSVSLGGKDSGENITTAGAHTVYISPNTATGTLSFTPGAAGTFVGTIDGVTIYTVQSSTPDITVLNSDGTSAPLEIRAGGSDLRNIFLGTNAGELTTTGNRNSIVGTYAFESNTTGSNNSGLGYRALDNNTTGSNNVAVGIYALEMNTTGSDNAAVGYNALGSNTTGSSNTAMGFQSLIYNTTGSENAAFGGHSLQDNTSGSENTAMGYYSLVYNTIGSHNVGVGSLALRSNTEGDDNVALGAFSLQNNITGWGNVAVGLSSLYDNTGGNYNSALGAYALENVTGSNNTALGGNAGSQITTGTDNTFLGYLAGYGGNQKIDATNSMALGANTYTTANNQFVYGDDNVVQHIFQSGHVGIGNSNPVNELDVTGDIIATDRSSLGSELVMNGTFTGSATLWDLGAGWSYNSNNVIHTAGNTATLSPSIGTAVSEGQYYRLEFTVSGRTAGSVTPSIYGLTGTAVSTNITYTQDFLSTWYSSDIIFTPTSDFNGVIDNVSLKLYNDGDITAGGTGRFSDIVLANPGIGNDTRLTFQKLTDSAYINVNEVASDSTEFSFNMSDNPDQTGDKFYWRMTDWRGKGGNWIPLQFSGMDMQIAAANTNIYSNLNVYGPSYSANGVPNTASQADLAITRTGTASLTPGVSGYTETTSVVYWVTIDADGAPDTFKWGTGSNNGTPTASGVAITGSAQTLSNGVTITFNSTTNGALNDNWQFRVLPGGHVLAGTGTVGAPAISFTGDSDTGIYSGGANNMRLVTGGTNRITIDSSGNVGVGTTSPVTKLTVGDSTTTTSQMTLWGEYQSSGFTNSNILNFRHGGFDRWRLSTLQKTAGSNDFDFKIQAIDAATTGYNDWLTVKGTNGFVGIGTVTPSVKLHLYDVNTNYSAPTELFRLTRLGTVSSSNADNSGGRILFQGQDIDGNINGLAYIDALMIDPNYNSGDTNERRSGDLVFSNYYAQSSTRESMRIKGSSGNVGIGTTSPYARLDARATGLAAFTGSSFGIATIGFTESTTTHLAALDFAVPYNITAQNTPSARIAMQHDSTGSFLRFGTSNNWANGITNTAMSIDPAGSVGIGVTAPSSTLDVNGQIEYVNGTYTSATYVCKNSSNQLAPCSSLRELKSNITDLGLGLDELMKLRPVKFSWNDSGMQDLGFIAEEVAGVNPLLAAYSEDGTLYGVKYPQLTSLLANSIQEQQGMISSQNTRIGTLETTSVASNSLFSNNHTELFTSSQSLEPNEIVSVKASANEEIVRSEVDNDRTVVGVVTAKVANETDKYQVQYEGKTQIKVSVTKGAITAGDMLTTSKDYPGVAVKATEQTEIYLGIALEPAISDGVIKMFIQSGYKPLTSATGTLTPDQSQVLAVFNLDVQGKLVIKSDVEIQGKLKITNDNSKGVNVPIVAGNDFIQIQFTEPRKDSSYAITVTPTWLTNTAITEKTAQGFKVEFGTIAPSNAKIDWLVID